MIAPVANIKEKFQSIFKENLGILSITLKKSGVDNYTFKKWMEDEEFSKVITETKEYTGDFVEGKLLQKISDGDISAIIFYCRTQLKNRGYFEKK